MAAPLSHEANTKQLGAVGETRKQGDKRLKIQAFFSTEHMVGRKYAILSVFAYCSDNQCFTSMA